MYTYTTHTKQKSQKKKWKKRGSYMDIRQSHEVSGAEIIFISQGMPRIPCTNWSQERIWDTSKAMKESTTVIFMPPSLGQFVSVGKHRWEGEAGPDVETIGFHGSGKQAQTPLLAVDQRYEPSVSLLGYIVRPCSHSSWGKGLSANLSPVFFVLLPSEQPGITKPNCPLKSQALGWVLKERGNGPTLSVSQLRPGPVSPRRDSTYQLFLTWNPGVHCPMLSCTILPRAHCWFFCLKLWLPSMFISCWEGNSGSQLS